MTVAPGRPGVRRYRSPEDAAPTLDVFLAAVRRTAAAVYTAEQVAAWIGPDRADVDAWDRRRSRASTSVAELDGVVVGFADLLPDGLVDMLFVHPDAGRRGVASVLLAAVVDEARARGIAGLRTFASRSARPVFERAGFVLVAERPHNSVRGVVVPNAELHRFL